jgi:hypothetical protein
MIFIKSNKVFKKNDTKIKFLNYIIYFIKDQINESKIRIEHLNKINQGN